METEIEAKWLRVDFPTFRARLQAKGAELVAAERLMIRSIFDYPDKRLEKTGGWVRVRDEGDKITLSYKQLNDRSLHGTKEVSLTINEYAAAQAFLQAIGLEQSSHQETKRESWRLGGAQIELDTWPWIPGFVEIEATSETELRQIAQLLDLDFEKALHGSVETAYQAEYDVSEAEIDTITDIRFVPVPAWLEAKRKN